MLLEFMLDLSNNELCVLRILEATDSITTSELIVLAREQEYADICNDCTGGDALVVAANNLIELGMITKSFGKGGFRWHLVRD